MVLCSLIRNFAPVFKYSTRERVKNNNHKRMEKKAFRHFSMRAAMLLLTLIFAFAGAQTGWGQSSCVLNFISQK